EPDLQIIRRSRRPLLRGLEQARRSAVAHHVYRIASMGARVLINGTRYKISVTLEPITSEQATNGQRLLLIPGRPPSSEGEAAREGFACKSMDRQKHLAEANRHIAELTVQIVRQRVIVKYALDTGQPSELSESLLHALEESLGAFKKHRELVLDQWIRRPSE